MMEHSIDMCYMYYEPKKAKERRRAAATAAKGNNGRLGT
jgi:hypothetical protein